MKNHIADKAEAIERIGDEDIYREIARLFASHLPDYITQLSNAMQTGDLPTIRRVTHSIKSSCATIGAEGLRNAFAYIERQATDGDQKEVEKALPQALIQLEELQKNIENI